MDMQEILRKMRTLTQDSSEEANKTLNEGVLITLDGREDNITLDGQDADKFVSRLMQLSGRGTLAQEPMMPAMEPTPMVGLPLAAEPPMGMPTAEPMGDMPMDEPMDDLSIDDMSIDDEPMADMNEDIQISVDGSEADELLARLMQIASHGDGMPQQVATTTPAPLLPSPAAMSHDSMPADRYVCDDCGMDSAACDCDHQMESSVCEACGLPESMCECDMSISTQGVLASDLTMENADYDHGHDEVDSDGEEVDVDAYMYKPGRLPQRMVKGLSGDNPLQEEAIGAYTKIIKNYLAFLGEADAPNEDGAASPLTASNRDEFVKDPNVDKEIEADGNMSPMSNIKRQDVMR